MKASLNWLKEYIGIDAPIREVAEQLTMLGLEVEDIQELGERFKKFLVGEVQAVIKHPAADNLVVCTVATGSELLEIVCGAPNVAPGQKVAVALPGAIVPHGQHDPDGKSFVVSEATIRGVRSRGMICSSYELDLGEDRAGILVLGARARPGMPLAEYWGLDDTVLEIGITPNRPDALSHIGIAREIGAISSKRAKIPAVPLREGKRRTSAFASVRIEDRLGCPRYTARVIMGLSVAESPDWMKNRLTAIGIRPVNNVVDITNYVLMEIGQPLHAFDYDKIAGHAIVVRPASVNEVFVTLDGKSRQLRGSDLLICDRERPIAIAGVMGGANSEISVSTVNIIIESAHFSAKGIRRTSKRLGLNTDASQRFERGADPNITAWAVDRAAYMIQKECGGEVLRGRIDQYPKRIAPSRIKLRLKRMNELLGTTLHAKETSSLLKRLSILPESPMPRKSSGGALTFEVPTWRPDIEREIDLIEEVARIYGYNRIETGSRSVLRHSEKGPGEDFEGFLRQWLGGGGFNEVVTNSMQEKSIASLSSEQYIEIANPISKEMAALRTSLIPSILSVVRNNIFHGRRDLRLFEIGKVYFRQNRPGNDGSTIRFAEEDRLILALCGQAFPSSWDVKPRQYDMSDLKGEVEALFCKIYLDKFKFIPYPNTKALTDIGLSIEINGRGAGSMGRVKTDLLKMYEIEQDLFVAELSIDSLVGSRSRQKTYRPLAKYPPVMRDLALIVDEGLPVGRIEDEIRAAGSELLLELDLFDVYAGEQIEPGKKSCAFALEFMSEDHTLTQEEVDGIMKKIIGLVSSRLQATLRS